MASRDKRDIRYGIKAKVTTLGPNGLIDMQVCFELCVLIMRYCNALYKRNIAELSAQVFENYV